MIAWLMGLRGISPAEVQRLAAAEAVTVVDVNRPEMWRSAHVPGAVNLDPDAFGAADLPAPTEPLVFYCANHFCRRAPRAARRARRMGYTDVRVMSAGIGGWIAKRLQTHTG